MCLDPERRQIFTLGRYLDSTLRVPDNLKVSGVDISSQCLQWISLHDTMISLLNNENCITNLNKAIFYSVIEMYHVQLILKVFPPMSVLCRVTSTCMI